METDSKRPASSRRQSRMPATIDVIRDLWLDALVSPPAAALYLGITLFFVDLVGIFSLSYFGHSSKEATRFAVEHLGGTMVREQLRLLALQAALSLLGGVVVWALLAARDRVALRWPANRWWRLARGLSVAFVLHLYALARAMVWMPALFADQWYLKGGWRAWVQSFVTDRLGLAGLDILAVLAVLAFVFGPLARADVRRAWKPTRWWRSVPRGKIFLWGGLPVFVLAGSLALASWVLAPATATKNKGPNIVILASDGMRTDRVYDPKVAPHFASLGAKSAVFHRAYTSLARTFPSWVSLLTGRFPHSHGVRHMFPGPGVLARIGPTLPRILARRGWKTAVVSDYAGEIFSRVDLGFQKVDAPSFSFAEIVRQGGLRLHTSLLPYVSGEVGRRLLPLVNGFPDASDPFLLQRRVRAQLRRLKDSGQFFLLAFFSVTHFPYSAPWPYYRKFVDRGYHGPFKYSKTRRLGESKPSSADIRHVRGLYDGTIAAADDAVFGVLEELKRLGLSGRTIVVVTADHGENLYEADLGMGHGDHLRGEQALRIPLIVHVPGKTGVHVRSVVRDVDLGPTLAGLVGATLPKADGVDLRPLMDGKKKDLGLDAFSETGLWFTSSGEGFEAKDRMPYPEVLGGLLEVDKDNGFLIRVKKRYKDLVVAAKHRCIVSGKWKLIYVPLPDGVHFHLYDVSKDQVGSKDLAEQHPDVVTKLWRRLRAWMLRDPRAEALGSYVVPRPDAEDVTP